MKIIRIYASEDGESHFDDLEERGVEHRINADFTRVIDAYGLSFKEAGPQGDAPSLGDWHPAPQRQYVLFLAGKTEIEVSDGEKRVIQSGDVLLVEDTFGKGHRNRRLSPEPELWAFVRAHA
jgi:hypothetical protein